MQNNNMRIPESFVAKRYTMEADLAERAELIRQQKARNELLIDHAIKAAAKYDEEYKKAEEAKAAMFAEAEKNGNFVIPEEPKLLLVIRIKGLKKISPKRRAILNLFRLRQVNNAVFIRANKATLAALKLIDPLVTYGEPSLETVRKLIYARGYAKIDKQRIPIVDNTVIAENIPVKNIKCVEDLVHEIYTVGPNFTEANNWLWPFKLNTTELVAKRHHFNEGGDFGFRGHYINDLVEKMI